MITKETGLFDDDVQNIFPKGPINQSINANLPFSFPVLTCGWRSHLAAEGSPPGLPRRRRHVFASLR